MTRVLRMLAAAALMACLSCAAFAQIPGPAGSGSSVPITGTPSVGYVPIATSPTAAAWAALGGQSIAGLTVTSSFTATGLVTNADLTNPAATVNGQTCTLGSTCTIPAAAGTLTGTTLASGVTASSLTSVGTLNGLTSNSVLNLTAYAGAQAAPVAQLRFGTGYYSAGALTDGITRHIDLFGTAYGFTVSVNPVSALGIQSGGAISFLVNTGTQAGMFQASGGLSIGTVTDPGATNVIVAGTITDSGIATIGALTKKGTVCVSTTNQLYYSATTC